MKVEQAAPHTALWNSESIIASVVHSGAGVKTVVSGPRMVLAMSRNNRARESIGEANWGNHLDILCNAIRRSALQRKGIVYLSSSRSGVPRWWRRSELALDQMTFSACDILGAVNPLVGHFP